MFTSTMTTEELYKEVLKDFYDISTQANMYCDYVRKKFRMALGQIGHYRKVIKSRNGNEWTVFGCSVNNSLKIMVYAPIISDNHYKGYIGLLNIHKPQKKEIIHYTSHYMQRYDERYIKHYGVEIPSNLNMLEYMNLNAQRAIFIKIKDREGYYATTAQGIGVADFVNDIMTTHITFLGDDELTLKKQLIYDKEVKRLQLYIEMKRKEFIGDEINFFTIFRLARKYSADIETIKYWNEINKIQVPDNVVEYFYNAFKTYDITSDDELRQRLKENQTFNQEVIDILKSENGNGYNVELMNLMGFRVCDI